MGNPYFKFKQFTVFQDKTAMKVGVDGVLLGAWVKAGEAKNILDIGAGTGLLSLMLAQKSNVPIAAIEIDENAFIQAKENFRKSTWNDRISIIQSSVQDYVKSTSEKFDLIICNPPYFTESLKSKDNQRNLARHDNLLLMNDLIGHVCDLLSDNGRFCMIYPYDKLEILLKEGERQGLYPSKLLEVKGTEQKQPNRLIVEFSFKQSNCSPITLVVRDASSKDYTIEYKNITKDYYLAF